MGHTSTPKYRVETVTNTPSRCVVTPAAWIVKEHGKPTTKNLWLYLDRTNASFEPGGCNAHLRDNWPTFRYVSARIIRQSDDQIVVVEDNRVPVSEPELDFDRSPGRLELAR